MKGFYLLWCDHQWFTRQKIIWETRPAPRLIAIFADVANIQNQIWDTNNKRMQCWMVLHHVLILILPAPSCNVFLTHATQQGLDWSPSGSWQTYQGLMSTEQLRFLPILNFLLQTEELQLMLAQVEQILDIFDIGEDRAEDDQLDFSQFHSKVWFL